MGFSPASWVSVLTSLRVRSVCSEGDRGICPICLSGQITIYQDSHLPVHRYQCNNCHKAGDFLDLVSEVRQIKRNLAVAELKSLNAEVGGWYEEHAARIEYNRKVAAFAQNAWQECQGSPPRAIHNASAVTLLRELGVVARPTLGWTDSVISQSLGYATSDELEDWLRLQDPDSRKKRLAEKSHRFIPAESSGALVFPIRATPDIIEGFQLCYTVRKRWRSRTAMFPYRGYRSGGLIGHPDVLNGSGKVIVFEDYRLAARCQFNWLVNHTTPCPILAIVEDLDSDNDNLQMLAGRDVIFWSPKNSPTIIRKAATLGAKISNLGEAQCDIRDWLSRQDMDHLIAKINKSAAVWNTNLAGKLATTAPEESLRLIQVSNLSGSEVEQILDKLPDSAISDTLAHQLKPAWPYKRVSLRRGLVEQRLDGWYFLKNGAESPITDAPYRVLRVELDQAGEHWYVIEVRYQGNSYQMRIDRNAMTKQPMYSIQSVLLQLGVGNSCFDPHWESYGHYVSQQFYNGATVGVAIPVGVDAASNKCHLSNVSLDLLTGRCERQPGAVVGRLLPNAMARAIQREPLQEIANNPFLSQAALAFVYQLVCEIRQQQAPLVTLTSTKQAHAAREFLSNIGAIGEELEPIRTKYLVVQDINAPVKREVSPECLWVACNEPASWYYGGYRSTITLGEPTSAIYDSVTLQETILAVLAVYLSRYQDKASVSTGIELAWAFLLGRKTCTAAAKAKTITVDKIDKSLLSVINYALRTDAWEILHKSPAKPTHNQVWLDRQQAWLTFTSASINHALASWDLPRWDLTDIMPQLWASDVFQQQVSCSVRSCWQVKTTHIDLATRRVLRRRLKDA